MEFIKKAFELRRNILQDVFKDSPKSLNLMKIIDQIDKRLLSTFKEEDQYTQLLDRRLKDIMESYYMGGMSHETCLEHINEAVEEFSSFMKTSARGVSEAREVGLNGSH